LSPQQHVEFGGEAAVGARVTEELVTQTVDLPGGELRVLQPRESAELLDDAGVEWAPVLPYWSVLWRSGVALARELDGMELDGLRVVELGCGLAAPSFVAARDGATVLATDTCSEPLELVERSARLNDIELETAMVEWSDPGDLVERGPFDVVLAADVLYERANVSLMLGLLPRLAPEAWIADPGRPALEPFLSRAAKGWSIETTVRGVVRLHHLSRGTGAAI
jgi:predicted nicotinamide N-methyase